jgi:hypothetical protein
MTSEKNGFNPMCASALTYLILTLVMRNLTSVMRTMIIVMVAIYVVRRYKTTICTFMYRPMAETFTVLDALIACGVDNVAQFMEQTPG